VVEQEQDLNQQVVDQQEQVDLAEVEMLQLTKQLHQEIQTQVEEQVLLDNLVDLVML
jgi:hypothetical protein